jgi:cell wall-associated NlpC family hydrolase
VRTARPLWLRRATAVALAGVMGAVLLSSPASQAAPRQDLQQVEAQVRELEMQAGAAHEKAEQARLRLAAVQDELDVIGNRLERERDELRTVQASLADIARSVYASGGIDPTLQVLLAEDPTEFLAQAAVMSQLQQSQVSQLRQAQTSRLRLAQTEAEVTDREAIAAQAKADMAAATEQADSRLQQAQAVLADLQEQERQRLLQIQRERRAQQLEQARQAAAASSQAASQGTPASQSSGSAADQSGGGYTGGSRAQAAIAYALSQVGDPYSFSANPPSSWDCSKLTAAAWGQAGVGLTALSYTQWDQTRRVPVSEIQPGDLVFYFGLGAHHVAIYVGNGKMVSASNPSDGVEIIDFLGPWYKERFSGVGRVIG